MKACHRRWLARLAAGLLLAAPGSARASLIVKMTLEEMAVASEVVVAGTVRSVQAFWNPGRTMIFSRVAIDIWEAAKGSAPPTIEVVELGGTLDGLSVWVPGTPQFAPGEEVVVFLGRDRADGEWKVAGFAQGKFRIVRDRPSGQRVVQHVEPLRQVFDARLEKTAAPDPFAPVPLPEFLDRIRRLASGGRGDAR
jgi:hypothetical protein